MTLTWYLIAGKKLHVLDTMLGSFKTFKCLYFIGHIVQKLMKILIFEYINGHLFETLKLSWKLNPLNVYMPFAWYFIFSSFYSTYYMHAFFFQIFCHTAPYLHHSFFFGGWGESGNCPYGVDLVKKLVVMLQNVLWSCGSIRISFSRRTPDKV